MTDKPKLSREEALQKRKAQIDAQLKALNARKAETERKADTRRKVIAGALALEHMKRNAGSEFAKVLHGLLNTEVTRPTDRALFSDLDGVEPPKSTAERLKDRVTAGKQAAE